MFMDKIPDDVKTTTHVSIRYDCNGGFERCGKIWILKYKDAKNNFEKNKNKHICRKCNLVENNPGSRPEVREKMKKTCLERYGTEIPLNSKENIADRVEKMFGTQSAVEKIVAKRQKTSKERYGTDHPMKNNEIKSKQQSVLQNKYGVSAPLQNEDIKCKMQQTVKDRYGVKNVAMIPEVQEKISATMYEKYGVEHYNQLPEMRDYLRDNCREWLKESWKTGGPNIGITRPEEWNQKSRETIMKLIEEGKWNSGPKYSVKGHYQSKKCKRKNPMFRSSYELKVHWNLDNDPKVEWYDYEPFRIEYYDTEQKLRYYVIDFVVKYRNNDKPLALEVKNDYNKQRFEECGKVQAFIDECSADLNFEIWSNEEIKSLNLDLDDLLKSPLVKSL